MSSRFRLVIWDLPGLGRSQGPANRDFSLEKMAKDLSAVVDAAGKGPVILVGHSIGGMISQTYCRLHAQQLASRVAGIVLLHTTYTNPLHTALGRTLWKAIEKPILVPLNHLTVWLAPLAWLSNIQSFLSGNLHIVTRIASFSGQQTWGQLNYGAWLAAKSWPGVVARGNLAMLAFDEQQTLPHVELPVLVVAAHHDRMTCPDASDRLAALLPGSIESGIRGGHLGFWERPAEVCELISEFAAMYAGGPATAAPPSQKKPDAAAAPD
jgi:pimeloyl-ACP methyl ester carboxylesterase